MKYVNLMGGIKEQRSRFGCAVFYKLTGSLQWHAGCLSQWANKRRARAKMRSHWQAVCYENETRGGRRL